MEKISIIDMDPFIIPQPKYTPEYVSCDLETSIRRNASRSSEFAYNHMESGFITLFLGKSLETNTSFLASVRHSQRVNDPRVQFSTESNRCVLV